MWFRKNIDPEKIKVKNSSELHKRGLKIISHLPHLEYPQFREPREVAQRMMVMVAVFQLRMGAPKEVIYSWLSSNQLLPICTAYEQKILETEYSDLNPKIQTDIYWSIEAIWSFAWIGKLHNNLTFNSGVQDNLNSLLPNIEQNESSKLFVNNFKFRRHVEIFVMLDKFYRALGWQGIII